MKPWLQFVIALCIIVFGCAGFYQYSYFKRLYIHNIVTVMLSACYLFLAFIFYASGKKSTNKDKKHRYLVSLALIILVILLNFQNYLFSTLRF